jgi:hypothetical protein
MPWACATRNSGASACASPTDRCDGPDAWLRRACSRLAALWLLTLLSACDLAPKLAYNHADRLVASQIADYVTLDAAQKAQFKAEFQPLWQWHRQTQLPEYASALRGLADDVVAGRVDRARLIATQDQAEECGRRLIGRMQPNYVSIVRTLSGAQVVEVAERLQEEIDSAERDLEEAEARSTEQRRKRRSESMIKTVEKWTGRLDSAQQARVEQWAGQVRRTGALDLDRQRTLKPLILAHLEHRRDPDFAEQERAFDAELEGLKAPELLARQQANEEASFSLYADLAASLSEAQRKKVAVRLRHYADLAEELSQE